MVSLRLPKPHPFIDSAAKVAGIFNRLATVRVAMAEVIRDPLQFSSAEGIYK
jgi:hypothetical protein